MPIKPGQRRQLPVISAKKSPRTQKLAWIGGSAPQARLELATLRLTAACSAIELLRNTRPAGSTTAVRVSIPGPICNVKTPDSGKIFATFAFLLATNSHIGYCGVSQLRIIIIRPGHKARFFFMAAVLPGYSKSVNFLSKSVFIEIQPIQRRFRSNFSPARSLPESAPERENPPDGYYRAVRHGHAAPAAAPRENRCRESRRAGGQ